VDEWEYILSKLLLKVKDPSKIENTERAWKRIYNGDFIERIAKLEGLLSKKWLRK
jgi:putative ABC transport system permease protein